MSNFKIIDPIVALQGGDMKNVYPSRTDEITRLRAINAELVAVLTECSDDLELEIRTRFCDSAGFIPFALQNNFNNDMDTVVRARAAIEKAKEQT